MPSINPVRTRGTGPFAKALLLFAVMVLVWVAGDRLLSRGLPGSVAGVFTSQQGWLRDYQPFDSTTQQALMHRVAGFWTTEPYSRQPGVPLRILDRIEIKDNGIVWRVLVHTVRTPGGDSVRFVHIYDAYVRPFGWVKGMDSVMACDVRVLRQARIAGTDTCYGPTNIDTVWDIGTKAGTVGLAGEVYTRYRGELRDFFPRGLVVMLENAYRGGVPAAAGPGYEVGPGEIRVSYRRRGVAPAISLELPRCGPDVTPVAFARSTLSRAIGDLPGPAQWDTVALAALFDTTYGALLRLDLSQRFGDRWQSCTPIRIEVGTDGCARVAGARRKKTLCDTMSEFVVRHSKDWRFPSPGRPVVFPWSPRAVLPNP